MPTPIPHVRLVVFPPVHEHPSSIVPSQSLSLSSQISNCGFFALEHIPSTVIPMNVWLVHCCIPKEQTPMLLSPHVLLVPAPSVREQSNPSSMLPSQSLSCSSKNTSGCAPMNSQVCHFVLVHCCIPCEHVPIVLPQVNVCPSMQLQFSSTLPSQLLSRKSPQISVVEYP